MNKLENYHKNDTYFATVIFIKHDGDMGLRVELEASNTLHQHWYQHMKFGKNYVDKHPFLFIFLTFCPRLCIGYGLSEASLIMKLV